MLGLMPEMAPSKDGMVFYSSTLLWIRLNYSMLAPGGKAVVSSQCLRRARSLTVDEILIKEALF